MIDCYIFDIGNVLVYFSHKKMWQQLASLYQMEAALLQKQVMQDGLPFLYEKGLISTHQVIEFFKAFHPSFSPTEKEIKEAISHIFRPNLSIYPIIKKLKEKKKKLILLSNTSELHFLHIKENYPIVHLFDQAILSYEVHALKPEMSIFEKAHLAAGCDKKACLYIDDIPEYTEVGKNFGFQTLIYKNNDQEIFQKY